MAPDSQRVGLWACNLWLLDGSKKYFASSLFIPCVGGSHVEVNHPRNIPGRLIMISGDGRGGGISYHRQLCQNLHRGTKNTRIGLYVEFQAPDLTAVQCLCKLISYLFWQ